MLTVIQPQQQTTTQPTILKVADGVWYAGESEGILQFTCDKSQAARITPEALPHVVKACKAAGYGKQRKAARTLTHPEVAKKQKSFRYMVNLYSLDLDAWGIPADDITLDVVVTEPTAEAVENFLKTLGWLTDWKIASIWEPEDCDEF